MNEIEIGPSKRARVGYSFDDIAIVPSRRTRDPEDVSINWQIDAYKFALARCYASIRFLISPHAIHEIIFRVLLEKSFL